MSVLPSVVDAMRDTHIVALDRAGEELGLEGRLLAKLDYLMPGCSKKDRAARSIIEEARSSGELAEGQTVVEMTSGNMGAGLAIVCAVLGHHFVAVMSEGNSVERARMMRALGAEVVLVPQGKGSRKGEVSGSDLKLVDDTTSEIATRRGAFLVGQFTRAGNPNAHESGTAPEIWRQANGEVTAFCDFIGSGGTLGGAARFFSPRGVKCYAINPDSDEHPIQGGGYGYSGLQHLADSDICGSLTVTGEEARFHARLLAKREGIFGGYSAGANLAGAVKLLKGPEKGGTIAFVVCDSGLKYFSTDLWE